MSTNQRLTVRKDDIKRYIQYLYDISGKPPTYVKNGKLELNASYENAVKKKYAKEEEEDEEKKKEKLTWDAIQRQINEILDAEDFKGFIRTTKPFGNHVSGDVREMILEYNNNNQFGSDFSDDYVKYYKNEIIKNVNFKGRWDDSDKRKKYINILDSDKEYLDEEEADNNIDGLVSTIHSAMENFNNIAKTYTLDGVIVYKDLRDKFTTLYPLFKEKFNSLPDDDEYYNNHAETINRIKNYIRNIENLTSLEKNVNYNPNDGRDYASDAKLIDTDTILSGMPIEYKKANLDDIRKYAAKRLSAMTHVSDDTYKDVAEDIYRSLKDNNYNHHQPERALKSFKDETENRIKINEEHIKTNYELYNKIYNKSKKFSSLGEFENELYGFNSNPMKPFERMRDDDFRDVVSKAISPEFLDEVFGEMSSKIPLEQSKEELPKDKEVSDGLTVNELAESLKQTVNEIKQNEGIENEPNELSQTVVNENTNEEQPFDNEMRESVKDFKYEEEDGQEEPSEEEQEESFETSESSTIKSVNEEEEDQEEELQEDENIPNEMNDSDETPSNLQTLKSVNIQPGFANGGGQIDFGGLTPVKPQQSINDEIHDSVEQFEYELPEEEENPLAIQAQSSSPAVIEALQTGVNSMKQDPNDIGRINTLLEAMNNQIASLRYTQSSTDTNNILGSIVSIFKELPNTGDDEIANKLSEAVGPDGKKLFESKEEAARFISKMRALNGNRLSSIKGGGSSQKTGIQLNITNKVVSNMPPKPFIVDTHPIPYQY